MPSSMHRARRVAVYCGSSSGTNPAYLAEAVATGKAIAAAGLGLVYGGASVGLMGAVADAALAGGAEVIGVLPEILSGSEIAHRGLTRLEMVPTMHQRKARMVKLADAFLMLPGGYGSWLFESRESATPAGCIVGARGGCHGHCNQDRRGTVHRISIEIPALSAP